jgi:hypothetical protein
MEFINFLAIGIAVGMVVGIAALIAVETLSVSLKRSTTTTKQSAALDSGRSSGSKQKTLGLRGQLAFPTLPATTSRER